MDKQLILSLIVVIFCVISIAMSYIGIQVDEVNYYAYVMGLFIGVVGIVTVAVIVLKRGLI